MDYAGIRQIISLIMGASLATVYMSKIFPYSFTVNYNIQLAATFFFGFGSIILIFLIPIEHQYASLLQTLQTVRQSLIAFITPLLIVKIGAFCYLLLYFPDLIVPEMIQLVLADLFWFAISVSIVVIALISVGLLVGHLRKSSW